MLEARDLAVSYGPVQALAGVSLTVGAHEAVALLGANGAGKTTTLRAISRLVNGRGSVVFDGRELPSRAHRVARHGLIHVPEGRRLFGSLSVAENLQVGARAGRGRSADYTVADVYDLFPALVPLRDRKAWALSGGEQQMVAVARALLAAPRMLLLDEPSLGLSPRLTDIVFDALNEIKRRTALLVVEQNAAMALETCTRGYVLFQGRVVLEAPRDELADRDRLLLAYRGEAPPPAIAETNGGTTHV
jgi:branched-chain amino acid transport system ATP-binding protein